MKRAIGELNEPASAGRQRCILMGHSMGCITAATAALDPSLSPQHTTLVLVAPALPTPSSKKLTAEQQRASARKAAAAAAASAATGGGKGSGDELLRGGGRRGAGSSRSDRGGLGLGSVVGTVAGAPVKAANTLLHAGVWVFNWCLLPMLYPLEILGLRCVGSDMWCSSMLWN